LGFLPDEALSSPTLARFLEPLGSTVSIAALGKDCVHCLRGRSVESLNVMLANGVSASKLPFMTCIE
jgi:hypothetical protein